MAKEGEKIDIISYVVKLQKGDIDGHDLARMVEDGTLSKSDRRKITRKHAKGEGKVNKEHDADTIHYQCSTLNINLSFTYALLCFHIYQYSQ